MGKNIKSTKTIKYEQDFQKLKIIETEKRKELIVMGKVYMGWDKPDELAPKIAIVQLYQQGIANQEELADIFQVHINSIYNYITTFKETGTSGLINQDKGPKESWKVTPDVRSKILYTVMIDRIKEYTKIQELLKKRWKQKLSIESIRQVLRENGFLEEKITTGIASVPELFDEEQDNQLGLDFTNARTEGTKTELTKPDVEKESSVDGEIRTVNKKEENRKNKWLSSYSRAERKYLDNLECGEYNGYAGGMLFNVFLEKYNYLPIMSRVIDNRNEDDYDLKHLWLTLFHYDLFEFNSIRNYSYAYSEEFGLLLGRSNSPCRQTLQKFLREIKKQKKSEMLMEEFAKEYLRNGLIKWGELYIDGHFQPYYGIAAIPMGWHGVRKIPMKGNYNFMSTDGEYNPWIFLLRAADEDLLEMIPEIIERAKKIGKEIGMCDDEINKLTAIFDREGYCAELFRTLSDKEDPSKEPGKDAVRFISWAKNVDKYLQELTEEEFKNEFDVQYEIQKAEKVKYFEIENGRMMNKYGKIRAIVIQSGSKDNRAMIYTNDKERKAEEIINLICRRWGEENLIKALMIDHYLDYYPGKGLYECDAKTEPVMVDNPEVLELKKEKSSLASKLNELKVKLADSVRKMSEDKINWEEIKKSNLVLLSDIVGKESQITLLEQKISKLPAEVRYEETHNGEKLFVLDYEKKRFLDCIKIFVYHMQKRMISYLSKYYGDSKDIHSVLEMIVHRGAYVRLINGNLLVRFKRFMNHEIDFAARHLCEEINNLKPKTIDKYCFPIHFEVE